MGLVLSTDIPKSSTTISRLCTSTGRVPSTVLSPIQNGSQSRDRRAVRNVTVRCWNVNGRLAQLMLLPNFRESVSYYDVNLFQETHFWPDTHETILAPAGYKVVAKSRKPHRDMRKNYGGVAAIVSDMLEFSVSDVLSAPDLLVLDFGAMLVFNAYILPSSGPWKEWADVHPLQSLNEKLAIATGMGKPILLMGDLNGRIGDLTAHSDHPMRFSVDEKVNSQGNHLLQMARDFDLQFLNGTIDMGPSSGNLTSFQPNGASVIDYAICDAGLAPFLKRMVVEERPAWADHAAICVELQVTVNSGAVLPRSRRKKSSFDDLPLVTELDRMLVRTLQSTVSDENALRLAYGLALVDGDMLRAWTDGSCLHNGTAYAAAGAGVFFGVGNGRNCSVRVCGSVQTNNRGELLALLKCLALASPRRTLQVFTDSEYVIKSVCVWGPKHAICGWTCKNGDILRDIALWLKWRVAPVCFVHIPAHSGNIYGDAADGLAKAGALLVPESQDYVRLCPPPLAVDFADCQCLCVPKPKVSWSLPTEPEAPPTQNRLIAIRRNTANVVSHRRRAYFRELQDVQLNRLLEARFASARFWAIYRKMADSKNVPVAVSLERLANAFRSRMNRSVTLPIWWDHHEWVRRKDLADSIPARTIDYSDGQWFSRPWVIADIEWCKDHIKTKGPGSASGLDESTYKLIMDLDNNEIVSLFNRAFDLLDGPTIWFRTLVMGILKRGRYPLDPDSYRAVALEGCLLKMLTMMIHKRMYDWAVLHNLLPRSQNGFRAGYRTNNNAFILRCAIDRALGDGKTLYVGFVDVSNAFPSTDQATLWIKLMKMGITGKLFDWLRMLYRKMEYMVIMGDMVSETFKSTVGVLIGDPASPTLWNLFLADFALSAHPDDVSLVTHFISHLEHADDMLLMSYSVDGLQHHFDGVFDYCCLNFLSVNAMKSWYMCFGRHRGATPSLTLGGDAVRATSSFTYVGVTFRSTHRNIFVDHYQAKADKARKCIYGILSVESLVHTLPPKMGRLLYTARVDPHLISGCEVIIDVDVPRLTSLYHLQYLFLRRLLHVQSRSMVVPLFTELGLMPLRYRRLILALRYLGYVIERPESDYVHVALRDSYELFTAGQSGWFSDLFLALNGLPIRVVLPGLRDLSTDVVEGLIKQVRRCCAIWLQRELDSSPKLYLIHGRLEPQDDKPPKRIICWFRHYLEVPIAKHRIALTRMILSDHCLAIERLRWADRYHPRVPRDQRFCRFCRTCIESVEHALFFCVENNMLRVLRAQFVVDLNKKWPGFGWVLPSNAVARLKLLVMNRETVPLLAKFVYEVLHLFNLTVLPRPSLPLISPA